MASLVQGLALCTVEARYNLKSEKEREVRVRERKEKNGDAEGVDMNENALSLRWIPQRKTTNNEMHEIRNLTYQCQHIELSKKDTHHTQSVPGLRT